MDNFVLNYMRENNYSSCQISNKQTIQRLWSGYGEIVRYGIEGKKDNQYIKYSVIVKNVRPPKFQNSRDTKDIGHTRKLRSYQVETNFYEMYSSRIVGADDGSESTEPSPTGPRVPRLLCNKSMMDDNSNNPNQTQILLEDLDAVGFSGRQHYGSNADVKEEIKPMVRWLAQFHGAFLLRKKNNEEYDESYYPGLWEQGCYWHLDTRPDEFRDMRNGHALKKSAKMLDKRLKHHSDFITLVHGDAKVCNFCFPDSDSTEGDNVAAVDFQYCGGGIGLRDLAYLLQSCMSDDDLEFYADDLLDYYFEILFEVPNVMEIFSRDERQTLEAQWRDLWSTCFADFERFLIGWSLGHESYGYGKQMVQKALNQKLPVDSKM